MRKLDLFNGQMTSILVKKEKVQAEHLEEDHRGD